jgi:hypothetical protein
MLLSEVRKIRLYNQQLIASRCKKPADVVSWLVAMQSQEFRHAKWAIGLRLQKSIERDVEAAFNAGAILRTHLMRPTWHFVSPEDIRWLLALTAPRVHQSNNPYYKKLELSKAFLLRCHNVLTRSLEGSNHLTRNELQQILKRNRLDAEGIRLAYIMMHAELEGLICSGPRIGKQFSYALLDERSPTKKNFDREEALSAFLLRYFNSRGPATLNDFSYWSGLTLKDARTGVGPIKGQLHKTVIDGKEYFSGNLDVPKKFSGKETFVMPDYDEYGMSYKDRSALMATEKNNKTKDWSIFGHYIIIDGTIQGSWKSEEVKDTMLVTTKFMTRLSPDTRKKVDEALKRCCDFFELELKHLPLDAVK